MRFPLERKIACELKLPSTKEKLRVSLCNMKRFYRIAGIQLLDTIPLMVLRIEIFSILTDHEEKQLLVFRNFNHAFTFAIQDVKALWKQYRDGYERELKK